MNYLVSNNKTAKVALILFFVVFQSFVLNAQIRTRTKVDSIKAAAYGQWYNPAKYQFDLAFPKLTQIPPLSTDMDFNTMLSYILLDSLMRSDKNTLNTTKGNFEARHTKNDTIINFFKYLYQLRDYDPIRFEQYGMAQDGHIYSINLRNIEGYSDELLNVFVMYTPNQFCMQDLNNPAYILHVHVNNVDSLPWLSSPGKFIYRVYANVLDTLKGRVYQNCCTQNINNKKSNDQTLNIPPCICFSYVTGPYSNGDDGYVVDNSLLNIAGNLTLKPNQELIVFLNYYRTGWDYNYDYFRLSLTRVLPVINGLVKDNNHEFSNNLLMNYSNWKNAFFQKRNLFFNGGY